MNIIVTGQLLYDLVLSRLSIRIQYLHLVLCVALLGLGLVTLYSPAAAVAATYYVDASTGNDSNNGLSEATPWRSLNRVNNPQNYNPPVAFQPGDQILLKRGETWYGGIWFKYSGEEGNPITIGAYGSADEQPLLIGTYWATISWENATGNIYRTTNPSWSTDPGILFYQGIPRPSIATIESATPVDNIRPGAVLVQKSPYYGNFWITAVNTQTRKLYGITFFTDAEKYWLANSSVQVRQIDENTGREVTTDITISENGGLHVEPESLTAPGQWYWDPAEHAIYLYAENANLAAGAKLGQSTWGVVVNGFDYITVQDITFRGFKEVGAYFVNATGITIDNINIYGVGTNGHMTGILLNEVRNSKVENSRVEYALRTGISIYSWRLEADLASNNTVSGNHIINSGSAGISLTTDTVQRQICVRNNLISDNIIENSNLLSYDAAGIYLLNIGENNRIISNTIRNGGSAQLRSAGIMVDSDVQPVLIDNNTIENNSLGGITVTGASHVIKNNVLRNNGVPSWESAQLLFFTVKVNAQGCTVENNAMESGPDQVLFMVLNGKPGDTDIPHSIDNNEYVSQDSSPFCWTSSYVCPEDDLTDFAHWKCASGTLIDSHSTFNGTQPPEEPPACEVIIEPPDNPVTYYVSFSTGNDANTGTSEDRPWKNISKISKSPAGTFGPGDKILFKRGDVWHSEGVTIQDSGIEGYPITIGAYGDPQDPPPLFEGTYGDWPFKLVWEQVEGNIYRCINWNWEPGLIFYNGSPVPPVATLQFGCPVDRVKPGAVLLQTANYYCNMWVTSVNTVARQISGITFFRDETIHWLPSDPVEVRQLNDSGEEEKFNLSLASPGGLMVTTASLTRPGQWYWDPDTPGVFIYSDNPPAGDSVKLSQYRYGTYLSRVEHVQIRDIDIKGYNENGIYTFECGNIQVQNVHIEGIGANGHRSGVLFHNTSNSSIVDSTVTDCLVSGIGIYSMSPGPAYGKYSWNNKISGNTVLRSGSAGISVNTDHPAQAGNIINTVISNNTVEEANTLSYDSAGIYILNVGIGNSITGNTIRDGGSPELRSSGIMLDGAVTDMQIRGNIVENNSLSGMAITGSGHEIVGNTIQFNASSSNEGAQIVFFTSTGNASGCSLEDNIVHSREGEPLFMVLNGKTTINDLPHTIDNNRYIIHAITGIDETYPAFCWNADYTCEELINFNTWKSVSCEGGVTPCRDADSTLTIVGTQEPGPDYDNDGDVDGLDLAALANGLNPTVTVEEFANAFGDVY